MTLPLPQTQRNARRPRRALRAATPAECCVQYRRRGRGKFSDDVSKNVAAVLIYAAQESSSTADLAARMSPLIWCKSGNTLRELRNVWNMSKVNAADKKNRGAGNADRVPETSCTDLDRIE